MKQLHLSAQTWCLLVRLRTRRWKLGLLHAGRRSPGRECRGVWTGLLGRDVSCEDKYAPECGAISACAPSGVPVAAELPRLFFGVTPPREGE